MTSSSAFIAVNFHRLFSTTMPQEPELLPQLLSATSYSLYATSSFVSTLLPSPFYLPFSFDSREKPLLVSLDRCHIDYH
ncbi:hypothetical protein ACLOJK_023008 [Asimina triloba]